MHAFARGFIVHIYSLHCWIFSLFSRCALDLFGVGSVATLARSRAIVVRQTYTTCHEGISLAKRSFTTTTNIQIISTAVLAKGSMAIIISAKGITKAFVAIPIPAIIAFRSFCQETFSACSNTAFSSRAIAFRQAYITRHDG